jgi:hypothetical protein
MTSLNLNLYQGSTFSTTVSALDSNGNAINLSGYNTSGYLRLNYSNTGFYNFSPVIKSGVSGEAFISGLIDLTITPSITSTIPVTRGVYDVEIYSGNYATKVVGGYVNIYPEATF